MQGLRPLFLLRLRLAPKQASAQADAVKVTPNPNF